MATYRLCYEVKTREFSTLGELQQFFEALSDDEARQKAEDFMREFRRNAEKGMTYQYLGLLKKID